MRLQDRFFSHVPAAYKPIYSMVVETAQKEHSIPLAFAKKKVVEQAGEHLLGFLLQIRNLGVVPSGEVPVLALPKPSSSRPPPNYYAKVMPFWA